MDVWPYSETAPEVLYLYLAAASEASSTHNILSARQIKASQAGKLNDPFDLIPAVEQSVSPEDVRGYLNERGWMSGDKGKPTPVNIAKMKARLDGIARDPSHEWQKVSADKRLLCFSSRNNGVLLWSHYASRHSGFVVGFSTKILRRELPSSVFFPVKYSVDRPQIRISDFRGDIGELSAKVYSHKSIEWKYEQEWRAIHNASTLKESTYLPFRPEAVSEIILGALIEPESEVLLKRACQLGNIDGEACLKRARLNSQRFEIELQSARWRD